MLIRTHHVAGFFAQIFRRLARELGTKPSEQAGGGIEPALEQMPGHGAKTRIQQIAYIEIHPGEQIGELLGLGSLWRPITLSPFATLNSLLSLVVPFSALLLIAVQDRSKGASQRIVVLILVAALLSSMLGIMQMLGSYRNPFYLYRISNFDSPVGFFANRNHQSVFLAINVVACAFMFARGIELGARGNILKIFALISAILLAAMVFINGSRAGLIVLALAMMISLAVIPLNAGVRGKKGKLATLQKLRSNRYLLVALPVILLGALLIGRKTVVVDRLIQSDIAEDLRGQTFSQVVDMAIAYLPLGTGFGSFEYVYRAHEKLQLLIPAYLNEAHNDLLQIVVEGGLPAVAILLAGVSWLVFTGTNLLKKGSGERRGLYIFCLSVCGFVALASAVDYPVRTPIFMTVLAMVIAMLSEARHRLELAGTPGVK